MYNLKGITADQTVFLEIRNLSSELQTPFRPFRAVIFFAVVTSLWSSLTVPVASSPK